MSNGVSRLQSRDNAFRFGQSLDLTFRYRYYDLDNKGSRVEFPGYVRFDAVWEAIARVTVPYGYTKQNASAELGWDLARATRLGFSFERESWNRKFREIKDSDENIWKATFDTRPTSWFALRSSYSYGDRSTGNYSREESIAAIDADSLLPDVLSFDPRKPAQYPNGRVFTDDVIDHRLAFLTKGECPPSGLKPHADTLGVFPYLGTPHAKTG